MEIPTISITPSTSNINQWVHKTSTTFERTRSNPTLCIQAISCVGKLSKQRNAFNSNLFTNNKPSQTHLHSLHKPKCKLNLFNTLKLPKSALLSPSGSLNQIKRGNSNSVEATLTLPEFRNNYINMKLPSQLSMDMTDLFQTPTNSIHNYIKSSQNITRVKYFLNEQKHTLTTYERKRSKDLIKSKNKVFHSSEELLNPTKSLNLLHEYNIYLKQRIKEERKKEEALFKKRKQLEVDIRSINANIPQKTYIAKRLKSLRNLLICFKLKKRLSNEYFDELSKAIKSQNEENNQIKKKTFNCIFSKSKNLLGKKKNQQGSVFNVDSLSQPLYLSLDERQKILEERKAIIKFLAKEEQIFKSQIEFEERIKAIEDNNNFRIQLLLHINDDISIMKVEMNKMRSENSILNIEIVSVIASAEIELQKAKFLYNKLHSRKIQFDQSMNRINTYNKSSNSINNKSNTPELSLLKYQSIINQGQFRTEFAYVFVYLSTIIQNIMKYFNLENYEDILFKAKFFKSPDDYNYEMLCRFSIEFALIIETTINFLLNRHNALKQNKDTKELISELERKIIQKKKAFNTIEQQKIIIEKKKEVFEKIRLRHQRIVIKQRQVAIIHNNLIKQKRKINKKRRSLSIDDIIYYNEDGINAIKKDTQLNNKTKHCKSL